MPQACTFSTAQQPLRVAEFDELFAAVLSAERVEPTRLLLELEAAPQAAGGGRMRGSSMHQLLSTKRTWHEGAVGIVDLRVARPFHGLTQVSRTEVVSQKPRKMPSSSTARANS